MLGQEQNHMTDDSNDVSIEKIQDPLSCVSLRISMCFNEVNLGTGTAFVAAETVLLAAVVTVLVADVPALLTLAIVAVGLYGIGLVVGIEPGPTGASFLSAAAFASASVGIEAMIQRLNTFRNYIAEWIHEFLYLPEAQYPILYFLISLSLMFLFFKYAIA